MLIKCPKWKCGKIHEVPDDTHEFMCDCYHLIYVRLNYLQNCGRCVWWEVDKHIVSDEIGSCVHPKIHDMISVGHCDDWDFDKNFGCVFWREKNDITRSASVKGG